MALVFFCGEPLGVCVCVCVNVLPVPVSELCGFLGFGSGALGFLDGFLGVGCSSVGFLAKRVAAIAVSRLCSH